MIVSSVYVSYSRVLGSGDKVLFPGNAYAGSVTVYTENRENFEVIKDDRAFCHLAS